MPSTQDDPRWDVVEEDLRWLISNGVTDGESLAQRLGFTSVATFERYCYRRSIPLAHKKSPFLQERPRTMKDLDDRQIDISYKSSAEERELAARCVHRAGGNERTSVLDLLDMLGLATESQLV